MVKKHFKPYFFRINVLLLFTLLSFQKSESQELYIGSGGQFFLKSNIDFTTSSSLVSVVNNGEFILEAGSDWGSDTEYVDGSVSVIGTGDTKLPTGDNGVYAPVFVEHTGNIAASYVNNTPTSGSNGSNVDAVANVEYWELTGNAVVTLPWNSNSEIADLVNNNGGKLSSVAIVGYDNGTWDLISGNATNTVTGDLQNGDVTSDINIEVNLNGFTQFTFGIDHQVVLSLKNQVLTNGIKMVSNPVKSTDEQIQFVTKNEMKDLQITLYDINGRQIKVFNNLKTSGNMGAINKPNLKSGIYLMKFVHEGKQGVKKIIIE
jgi:hypothetical protein